jgi:hypothetical protein
MTKVLSDHYTATFERFLLLAKIHINTVGADASRPCQRGRIFPSADCPGALRLANQRMQRVSGPASRLALPSTADPRPRYSKKYKIIFASIFIGMI